MSVTMERETVTIKTDVMIKYLNFYVGETDWQRQLGILYENLNRKMGQSEARETLKKAVAFAVMGQEKANIRVTDNPAELLHTGYLWHQCKERSDWVDLFMARIKEDEQIAKWRNECLSLGIVHPIEYSPVTRQAFNWLFTKAEEAGVVTAENKQDMIRRFQNLVLAYGGNVICYIFMKEEYKIKRKVMNWRSNYFFERLIFDTYTFEQVFKIKKQELAKTNSKLVKTVRLQEDNNERT